MRRLTLLLFVVMALACRRGNTVVVPNRVLDRPLDVVLTCMKRDTDGTITAQAVGACDRPTPVSCTSNDETQLIAFIANSERNEVAMARRCDTTAAVVDMDGDTPGYQLIPVGQLPSHLAATELGCRVVTSNAGSCDFSVLNATGLAGHALEVPPPEAPSSLVSRLVPIRSDGTPLGARPGVVLSAPDELSLAAAVDAGDDEGGDDDGGSTGAPGTGDGDSGDADDGNAMPEDDPTGAFSLCPDGKAESIWVTFPTCQLVAEMSLNSGQILQSRRFVTEEDGNVTMLDGGTAPDCPVDCPIQFDSGAPPTCVGDEDPAQTGCRAPVDTDGYFPTALELVRPPEDIEDSADELLTYPALFVGGLGSDTLVEIQFDGDPGEEDGRWQVPEDSLSLTLENAQGVHAVRATPPVVMSGGGIQGADSHQFLYVIAGDGATHVVDRSFNRNDFGNECDTQIDPTVQAPPYPSCNAIDPNTVGETPSPDRRPFALGPGLRVSQGAAITDWAFYKLSVADFAGDSMQAEQGDPAVPFATPGVVGVGVTSFGRVVLSTFNQLQDASPFNTGFDPAGIMNLSVPPHSLWPSLNPLGNDPQALPRVDDNEPDRGLPGPEDSAQVLAPSLRLIDLAYADAPDVDVLSPERQALADLLGNPSNADALGQFDGEGLYENAVAKVVVRDYQTWQPLEWSLVWEGTIPGTRSATGRIECDRPGHENGTCIGSVPGSSRLVDESSRFCDVGVLPGDKLVLFGCTSDDDCGTGQRCLQEPTAPASASGICISAQAFEEEFAVLRDVCAPFITEPCGDPQLEYVVTRAFQDELWLQSTDIAETSHLSLRAQDGVDPAEADPTDPAQARVVETVDRFTCELPYSTDPANTGVGCETDFDCRDQPGREVADRCYITRNSPDTDDDGRLEGVCQALIECEQDSDCGGAAPLGDGDNVHICRRGVCRGPCAGGDPECRECGVSSECSHYGPGAVCSDGMCMRRCETGDPDCTRARLPGPRCFAELSDYAVRVRNSFVVAGEPTVSFIADRVIADPETGECREDPSVSNLLTSRLRLGRDQEETFAGTDYPYVIPECPNADEAAPNDPNPCRITQGRTVDELSRFHRFRFDNEIVSAIRFSNPFMSIMLDLVDLRGLASEPQAFPGQVYPAGSFHKFKRGRIPRGYRQTFVGIPGFLPFSEPVVVRNTVMVYPVRIVRGPEQTAAFIVDAGGRGGPAGVRGQVIRIIASAIDQGGIEDLGFLVR